MKTLALTLAASLIASTSAFAGSALFDVNEAPINHGVEKVQMLDTEATASIGGVAKPADNDGLFDVNDRY
jgi:hypothetical protein